MKHKHKLADTLKSLKHQATHPLETLKNVANNVKTETNKFASKAEEKAMYLPLVPLVPAMVVGLKAKGVNVNAKDGVKGISILFYNKVIKGKKGNLEHADEDMSGGLDADLAMSGGTESVSELDNKELSAKTSKKLISKIVDFIKRILKKKQKPEKNDTPLTVEEKAIVVEATPVQDKLAKIAGGTDSKGDTHFVTEEGDLTHTLKADGSVVETGKPNPDLKKTDAYLYGTGFIGMLNKFFHHQIKHNDLEHLFGEHTKLISKPIAVPSNSKVSSHAPLRGLMGRFFSSVRHSSHLESLEHTEKRCGCHKK